MEEYKFKLSSSQKNNNINQNIINYNNNTNGFNTINNNPLYLSKIHVQEDPQMMLFFYVMNFICTVKYLV